MRRSISTLAALVLNVAVRAAVPIDLSGLAAGGEITVSHAAATDLVAIEWPADAGGARASLTLNLAPDQPLFDALGWQTAPNAPRTIIAGKLKPLTVLTVGERDLSRNGWMVFFDKVQTRPSQRFPAKLKPTALKNSRRSEISCSTRAAMAFSRLFSLMDLTKGSARATGIAVRSAMLTSFTLTARLSGRSLLPSHF